MRRRTFLQMAALGAGSIAVPRRARALGDASRVAIGQIEHAGRWNPRPSALRRLSWELAQRTSIDSAPDGVPVKLSGNAVHLLPFLYLAGDGAMPPFSEGDLGVLRRHLQYGGFLLVDAADGSNGSGFDASVRRELQRLLPASPLARIPREHVLYKSFYLLDHQGGRVITRPWMEGQFLNGRLAVAYSQNDLGGAWARGQLGEWEYDCTPGGDGQRETAFRLGVNLAMYALCTNYKDDAVHLPFILRRRS